MMHSLSDSVIPRFERRIQFFKISIILLMNIFVSPIFAAQFVDTKSNQYIDVGSPGTKKLRVAIPTFYFEKATPIQKHSLSASTERFKQILDFTDWFYFIPNNAFASKHHPATYAFKASDWKVVQANFVVLGTLQPIKMKKDRFNLELRAINVTTQAVVAQKKYSNISLDFDLALRDFGDRFIQTITGTPGPFMSQIAFVGRASGKSRTSVIYIADFDGGHARAITPNNTINLSPAWSPDGRKLTYTSFKTGKAEIFEYNLNTQKTRQLTFEDANSSGSSWNNTGDLIAFSSSNGDGTTHIFTTTGSGNFKEPLITSSGIAVEPAFSPSGTYLAYTSNKFSKPMLFLYDFETNETTRLTHSGWYNASAAWSPNSRQLAYASYDKDIDRWDLFKINVDGSGIERFTLKQGDNEKPSWSPDGHFIIFQSNRGEPDNPNSIKGNKYKLYVMAQDGTNQKHINTSVPDCRQPAWSARQVYGETDL